MFKIHLPETVTENCCMFMLGKFPGAKLVHLQKANWSIRTSAESKPTAILLSIWVYLNYWKSPGHGSGLNMYK